MVTYNNFDDMCNCVNEQIVSASIVSKLEKQKLYSADRKDIMENDKKDIFCLLTRYKLIQPEYLLFVNKCGYNAHNKSNTAVRGDLSVVPTDGSVEDFCGRITDIDLPTLRLTSGTSQPVMCAVIVKSKNDIPESQILGIDPDVSLLMEHQKKTLFSRLKMP